MLVNNKDMLICNKKLLVNNKNIIICNKNMLVNNKKLLINNKGLLIFNKKGMFYILFATNTPYNPILKAIQGLILPFTTQFLPQF